MISGARQERKVLQPADGVNRKVNLQAGPLEVIGRWTLYVGDLLHRGLLEPGELLVGQQQLFVAKEHPEAVPRDVGDFNRRSGGAMHLRRLPDEQRG